MPPLSVYYSFLIFKLTFRTTLRKTLSSISSTRAISAHHLSPHAHSFLTSKLVAASVWCGSPRSEQRWPNVRFSSCRKCKQNSVENSYHSVQAVSHSIIVGNHRSQCIYILSRLGPPTNQPHRIAAKNMLSNQICPRNCFPSFQLCLYKEHIPLQRRQWFHFSILHFSLHIHLFGLWFTPMLLKSCLIFFWCVSLRCNSSQLSPLQSLQSVQRSTRSTFQQITAIFKSPFFPSSVSHFFMSAGAAFDFFFSAAAIPFRYILHKGLPRWQTHFFSIFEPILGFLFRPQKSTVRHSTPTKNRNGNGTTLHNRDDGVDGGLPKGFS